MEKLISTWTGSATTAELVKDQIVDRWGQDEANNYDPKSNCLTFSRWLENGYQVKKGEKAIKSFIVIEQKDEKGNVVRKYPKTINLFTSGRSKKSPNRIKGSGSNESGPFFAVCDTEVCRQLLE